ncbi:MAG: putative Endopolygalacturonase, partial [Verrucomicrobiales bacterium]|nr:putative Endopolygalacturonase [Verrucomicrobiales bacterium]
ICFLPRGQYRVNGALTVPAGVTLCGVSGGVPHSEHPTGAVLLAYGGRGHADGAPLITLKPNGVLRNVTIHYPEQRIDNITPYPWAVRIDGELCQVLDVTMTNPFQAIDVGSRWNELHLIRNIFACPLSIGIYIDRCTDVGRIENVHFNPNFWNRMAFEPKGPDTGAIRTYLERNLTGFKVGQTDWEYISNCFVIFAKIGFHFNDFGHGVGNAVVTQSGSDICPCAVRVDRTQPHAGLQWANGQFMSTIEIALTNQGPVKFTNCGFWGMERTREHIRHDGASTLSLTSCHFTAWDRAGKKDPAIRAANGRLIVNGCEFMDGGKLAIRLDKGLKAATIFGCAFRGDKAIEDNSGAQVRTDLNITA